MLFTSEARLVARSMRVVVDFRPGSLVMLTDLRHRFAGCELFRNDADENIDRPANFFSGQTPTSPVRESKRQCGRCRALAEVGWTANQQD